MFTLALKKRRRISGLWKQKWMALWIWMCAQSRLTLCNLWTVAHQTPLSMEFSRQEYWSGEPCPFPGNLPHPGMDHGSSYIAGRFFTIWVTREALSVWLNTCFTAVIITWTYQRHFAPMYNYKAQIAHAGSFLVYSHLEWYLKVMKGGF